MPTNVIAGPAVAAPVDRMVLRVDFVRPGGGGTGDAMPLYNPIGSTCNNRSCFEGSYDE